MKTTKQKGRGGRPFLQMREGSCSVNIYSSSQTKNGKTYTTHFLTYMEGGELVRRGIADLDQAKSEAQLVLTRLVNGEAKASGMRAVDVQGAALAVQELDGLGVTLSTVAKEYRKAVKLLDGKGTIGEAVAYFLKHAHPDMPRKTVPEVSNELWEAKKADGKSAVYLKDIKQRLKIFGQSFTGCILDVTTQDLENWLRRLGAQPKHRNNYANVVTTLFNFAKRAGYLPADRITAAENLSRAKKVDEDIEIYTPEEIGQILARLKRFRPELLPYVAIGAFAGVRPAELLRLDWKEVDLDGGHIEIKASKAKTARRRLIPIQPCLAAWLGPHVKTEGPICSNVRIQTMVKKLIEAPVTEGGVTGKGVTWKQNALRHSYGSYRLPVINDAPKLALEMGNSPAMIFRHYRELVKPDKAAQYWAIMP